MATITLNRPHVLNALDRALTAELADAAETAARDADVWVVVVRGAGRAFCSGMDRTALSAGGIDEAFYRNWVRALNCFEDMDKLVVAVLHGYSIGGGLQLASACDLRLATDDAVLGLGATRHGLIPDGSILRLARLVGLGRAKELTLLNDHVDAGGRARHGPRQLGRASRRAWTRRSPPSRSKAFHSSRTANGHAKRLLHASFHRDPREMIEDVMRAQHECMTSWEIERGQPRLGRAAGGALLSTAVRRRLGPMTDDFILETEGLTKEFRGFFAVKDVDLRVRRGTIHALIGPNGAGKTTCFNLLTHFLVAHARTHPFNGRDITGRGPADIARLGLVRSFQISAVFPHLTVLENVRIALQRGRGRSFDFWRSERVLDALDERARELLAAVGLGDFAATPAVELPYGRKRALEIATTLALEPEMMLLDEPTAGMAHEDVDRISALIKQVAANRTVLMVEHNLSVVEHLSDTITVLARGEVLAEGDYAAVSRNPEVIQAYMGAGHE